MGLNGGEGSGGGLGEGEGGGIERGGKGGVGGVGGEGGISHFTVACRYLNVPGQGSKRPSPIEEASTVQEVTRGPELGPTQIDLIASLMDEAELEQFVLSVLFVRLVSSERGQMLASNRPQKA